MVKFWSEVRAARTRELAADISTWIWVAVWTVIAARVYAGIAGYAETGRVLSRGGTNLEAAGAALGASLAGVPLVGDRLRTLAIDSLGAAGEPFVYVGGELESLLILIARLLTVLLLGVVLVPWLTRYVPWRARRLATLRAADQAIRRSPIDVALPQIERTLALRALSHLEWTELLEHTRDPIGDFDAARYGGLARAELESVGLRPQRLR
jgi:hypothetical protein